MRVIFLVLTLALAACGGKSEPVQEPDTTLRLGEGEFGEATFG